MRRRTTLLAAALLLPGCTGADRSGPAPSAGTRSGPLVVAASPAPLAAVAAEVGGSAVRVVPTAPADVVLVDGLLPGDGTRLARARAGSPHSTVASLVPLAERSAGRSGSDPYAWTDPLLLARCADEVRDLLVAADPALASGFAQRHAELIRRATALSRAVRSDEATVPGPLRAVVLQPGFSDFARDYGWRLTSSVAPVHPGAPTAAELGRLAQVVLAAQAPVVFGPPGLPGAAQLALTRATAARYVVAPALAEPGGGWLRTARDALATLIRALGGSSRSLDALDVRARP